VSDTLTLRRLWLLLRSDAITDYRFVGMSAAAIAALLFLFSLPERSSGQFYVGWFATLLFTLGPIYVSASFRELHDKSRNEAYLLLPASALEKTLARLLRSSVGFVAFLLIIVTVGSFVNEGAKWLLLDRSAPVFNPFALGVWQAIGVFVPVQAMFFLGAAWFRRAHLIKTLLVVNAVPIVCGIVAVTVLRIVFGQFNVIIDDVQQHELFNFYLAHQTAFDAALLLSKLTFFVALPVFCWYVAWLRVKETQVSHGV
jgi:hypothetical protein